MGGRTLDLRRASVTFSRRRVVGREGLYGGGGWGVDVERKKRKKVGAEGGVGRG
jgi:hypothetical protein